MVPDPVSPQDPRDLEALAGLDGPDVLDGSDVLDGVDAARLGEDLAAVAELVASGVEVDGEVEITEGTWAVYGHIGVSETVVVGEYPDMAEAEAVLRAAPHVADDGEAIP